jgi:hypothetical protein
LICGHDSTEISSIHSPVLTFSSLTTFHFLIFIDARSSLRQQDRKSNRRRRSRRWLPPWRAARPRKRCVKKEEIDRFYSYHKPTMLHECIPCLHPFRVSMACLSECSYHGNLFVSFYWLCPSSFCNYLESHLCVFFCILIHPVFPCHRSWAWRNKCSCVWQSIRINWL